MTSSNFLIIAAGLAVALAVLGAGAYMLASQGGDRSRYLRWPYLRRGLSLIFAIVLGIGAIAGKNFFIGWIALMLLLGAIRGRETDEAGEEEFDRDVIWIDPEENHTEDSIYGRIDPVEPEPIELPPPVEVEPADAEPIEMETSDPIRLDFSDVSLPISSDWIIGGGLLLGLVVIGYAALVVSAASFTLFSAGMITLVIFGPLMWLLYSFLERRS